MISLYSLSAFIQFIGAFNFANVYDKFQDKIFKYFLNIDEEFKLAYEEMEDQIVSDSASVEKMEAIETTNGKSNKKAVENLKFKFRKLKEQSGKSKEEVKNTIEGYTMRHSRCIFLAIGLYCMFELLALGLLDIYKNNFIVYLSLILYNVITLIFMIYFCICEHLVFNEKRDINRFFQPNRLYTSIVCICTVIACVLFSVINNFIPSFFFISNTCMNICLLMGIVLPLTAFILSLWFTYRYYKKSKKIIKDKTQEIKNKYNELHDEKKKMDDFYKLFTSNISFN